MNVNSKQKFTFKQPSLKNNSSSQNLNPQAAISLQSSSRSSETAMSSGSKSLGSNTWSSLNTYPAVPQTPLQHNSSLHNLNSSPLSVHSSALVPSTSSSKPSQSSAKRSFQHMQQENSYCSSQSEEYPTNSSYQSSKKLVNSQHQLTGSGAVSGQDQHRAFTRPSTAATPQRISFPASESGSAAEMSGGGGGHDHLQESPLALLFHSTQQLQHEALSRLLSYQADLEKVQKQKLSLQRELGDVKREADKLKTEVSTLESDLAFQKKWNVVVDIRHKGMVSARDSILYGLQVTRAKSQSFQKEINHLSIWVEKVQKECAEQRQDRATLVSLNQSLKQELESAKETLAEQSKRLNELTNVISHGSITLGDQIDKLCRDNTIGFDSMNAAVDQSKQSLQVKLTEMIDRNIQLETMVVDLEKRLLDSVATAGEKQLKDANDNWQAQFLEHEGKHKFFIDELTKSHDLTVSSMEKIVDEKSALIDDLTSEKLLISKTAKDLTAQLATLQKEREAAQKAYSDTIAGNQKDLAVCQKDLQGHVNQLLILNKTLDSQQVDMANLKSALHDRDLKISELDTANKTISANLAQMKIDLAMSSTRVQDLMTENTSLKTQANRELSELIESGLKNVSTALSLTDSKEAVVRDQLISSQQKLDRLTAENLRLKSREEELCTKVSELHAAIEDKERHALEVTCKVSSLEQLLAKDREAAKEKAQADSTSLSNLREKMTRQEQDLENFKYKSDSTIKALQDRNSELEKELEQTKAVTAKSANGQGLVMSRSLSDIEAVPTGSVPVVSTSSRRSAGTGGALNVKKEAVGRAMAAVAGGKGKRGGGAASSKTKGADSKVMQRKINEKMEPKDSFDIFEAPF